MTPRKKSAPTKKIKVIEGKPIEPPVTYASSGTPFFEDDEIQIDRRQVFELRNKVRTLEAKVKKYKKALKTILN